MKRFGVQWKIATQYAHHYPAWTTYMLPKPGDSIHELTFNAYERWYAEGRERELAFEALVRQGVLVRKVDR